MNTQNSRMSTVRRRRQRRVFGLLCSLSMIFPAIVLGGLVGMKLPRRLETWAISAACLSALAMGALVLWAIRSVDRDVALPEAERTNWRKLIFVTGMIGAFLFLRGKLREPESGHPR